MTGKFAVREDVTARLEEGAANFPADRLFWVDIRIVDVEMELVEDDFRWAAERSVELAQRHSDGAVVSVLEGGYHPPALGRSVIAHLEGLAGGSA